MQSHGIAELHVPIIGKEPSSDTKPNNPKDVLMQSMRDSAEIIAAVTWLGLSLFIART